MTKKSSASAIPQKKQLSAKTSEAVSPLGRDTLLMTIEAERHRIFRARAVAQTAAKLLHELYVNERHEPDIGLVLDVVAEMLETSLARFGPSDAEQPVTFRLRRRSFELP